MERFLRGMHAMDAHFRSAPLHANLPVLLGLLNVSGRQHLTARRGWRLAGAGHGAVSSACCCIPGVLPHNIVLRPLPERPLCPWEPLPRHFMPLLTPCMPALCLLCPCWVCYACLPSPAGVEHHLPGPLHHRAAALPAGAAALCTPHPAAVHGEQRQGGGHRRHTPALPDRWAAVQPAAWDNCLPVCCLPARLLVCPCPCAGGGTSGLCSPPHHHMHPPTHPTLTAPWCRGDRLWRAGHQRAALLLPAHPPGARHPRRIHRRRPQPAGRVPAGGVGGQQLWGGRAGERLGGWVLLQLWHRWVGGCSRICGGGSARRSPAGCP